MSGDFDLHQAHHAALLDLVTLPTIRLRAPTFMFSSRGI